MATNATEVANQALTLLGASPIADITDTAVDRAVTLNTHYGPSLRALLRGHPWNFAMKRALLRAFVVRVGVVTFASGDIASDVVVTLGTVSLIVAADIGKRIFVTRNGTGKATVTSITDTTHIKVQITEPFSGLVLTNLVVPTDEDFRTGVDSDQWRLYSAKPAHTYEFQIPIPSDYVRNFEEDNTNEDIFEIEGRFAITNEEGLLFTYVYLFTDTTLWDPAFEWALVTLLAARVAFPITNKPDLAKQMTETHGRALNDARSADGQEGTPRQIGSNVLTDVRSTTRLDPWWRRIGTSGQPN